MAQRIMFQGKPGIAGKCRECGLIMIVTDKESDGSYTTYHQDPMCEWYVNRCNGVESIPLQVVTVTRGDNGGTVVK